MKKLFIASITATLLFSASAYSAESSHATPPASAASCAGCHGADGNSVVPNFPKLAGQHAAYIEKQLKDFRGGFRNDATMTPFAKNLSDADIKELGAFYSAQPAK